MVAVLLLPKQLGWQRATHKHQYPAWTSCVPASSPGCAAGTRQDLLTGLARALQALLKPTAPEWKRLPLCNDSSSGKLEGTGACSVAASYKPPMLVTRAQLPACACVAPLAGTNMSVWSMGHRLPAQRAWAMVAGLLLPTPLGWQRATHKHQYPAWTSCVSASSSVCAAGTRQNLFTGLARVLRAFLGPTATEWKYLPLCIAAVNGAKMVRQLLQKSGHTGI